MNSCFREKDTKQEPILYVALAEVLSRSHILSDLKEDMQRSPGYQLPPKLRRLHDILIQANFPIQDKVDLDQIVQCSAKIDIDHESLRNVITFTAFHRILNHFMTYDQNIMNLISRNLLNLPSGVQGHRMFMSTSVETDITTLLTRRLDYFLDNTFAPFQKSEVVELSHFQHAVNSLKAQEMAIENAEESEYGIPESHIQEHLMDTHSFLCILHRCSLYQPQEVSKYLEGELEWIGKASVFTK